MLGMELTPIAEYLLAHHQVERLPHMERIDYNNYYRTLREKQLMPETDDGRYLYYRDDYLRTKASGVDESFAFILHGYSIVSVSPFPTSPLFLIHLV